MAFKIENGTGSPLSIDDLGITLEVGETTELATRTQPQEVALSMEAGNELHGLISSGDVVVKDPLDGVTDLSVPDAIICLQSINDPHFRVGAGARAGDVAWTPTGDNAETDVQAAIVENSGKMEWKGTWLAVEYDKHDVVRDGDWTMIANKQTLERAAPVPDGQPINLLSNTPTWAPQANLSVVEVSHTYTFAKSGWLPTIRIWPRIVTSSYQYRLRISDLTDAPNPIVRDIPIPTGHLTADQWNEVQTNNQIVLAGSIIKFELVIVDSASTTDFTGGWTFDSQSGGNSSPAAPADKSFSTNGQWNLIYFDKDDLNSTDRTSELLSVTPDSEIELFTTADSAKSVLLRVEDDPLEIGPYVVYETTPIDFGASGPPDVSATTTCTFSVPVPSNTDYISEANIWNQPLPDFLTSVTSALQYDGVGQGANQNIAYGVDFAFQNALIPNDWDLIATSQITSQSGGSGGSIITQDEGIIVPNSPHGTLNFTGGGVTATDAGGGVTQISIPGGAGVSNAITTVVGDSGSFTGVGEDTLNIVGGTGITTAVVGDVLTITNDAPDQNIYETFAGDSGTPTTASSPTDQLTISGGVNISTVASLNAITVNGVNIWNTISGDAGSTTPDTPLDTLSVVGGAGISTSISGDVLTILNDSPNVDQNLWETILADSGSTVASTITDTLTVAGGLGIDTSITGDTLDIILNAVIDNLQDVDTVTDPPVIGSHLVWKVATSKWEPRSPLLADALGQMFEIVFSKGSAVSGAWIDSNGTPSNEAPPVCAWEARLAGLTFTNNRAAATTNIEIYRTAELAAPNTRTLVETWSLTNARTARKTDYTPDGGGNFIPFFEGDKISVYFDGAGGPVAPRGVTLILHFIITDFSSDEVIDTWVGNIADP